jgi:hypothetical protein
MAILFSILARQVCSTPQPGKPEVSLPSHGLSAGGDLIKKFSLSLTVKQNKQSVCSRQSG